MTVDITFPEKKRCLTLHSRSEINKMKFEESEYKCLNDAARVTGFTKLMSVYFVKNNVIIIYSMFIR